ncbi:MAG: metallo-beta-lactamase family protein [Acidobacteriota bacterium]|jgi:metallo-beta-lactamase family protein|nr:metallo-beta-lactamase family protein [Acidobacteriota bacterium]
MARLSFWGGVGTVTGSKYLVESGGSRVLVDCGLFQGLRELRERNWEDPPFDARSLDAVVITHAHVDHTAYLPRLVALGYEKPVYCSKGTADLLKLLLPDSARLQEEEAEYRNRKGLSRHEPALPLYTEADARAAIKLIQTCPNTGEPVEVAKGVRAGFRIAGHILGSSLVLLELDGAGADGSGRRVLFSGDLGHYDQPIIRDPVAPPECDYMLVESTYGDRLHDAEDPKVALARIINEASERGGPLLIPAFAVGRTQELVYHIRELEDAGRIPILPVRVDSPMAAAATQIYQRNRDEQDEEYTALLEQHRAPLRTRSMVTASTRDESKRLNEERGTRIIISASGMLTGGRVLHHARRILPDERATLLFVGYQAAGTTGRKILDGARVVRIMKEDVPVRCHVERVGGFSAHADWKEVLRWLEPLKEAPRRVFTTHGEPEAAAAMAGHIRERFGWRVDAPQYGESVELE